MYKHMLSAFVSTHTCQIATSTYVGMRQACRERIEDSLHIYLFCLRYSLLCLTEDHWLIGHKINVLDDRWSNK